MRIQNASITRRRALALGGLAGTTLLSGCASIPGSDGDPRNLEIRIANRRSRSESVTVHVASAEGGTIDAAEYDLSSSSTRTHRVEDVPAGSYRITVSGDGWRTTADWETSLCNQFLAETTLEDRDDGSPHTSLSVECQDE